MPVIKVDQFCFMLKKKSQYLLVYVTPSSMELIQLNGFLSLSLSQNFLTYLNQLSTNRDVYANPSFRFNIDPFDFCTLYHKSRQVVDCFHQALSLCKSSL